MAMDDITTAAPAPQAGPRLPRREVWLDLPEEYPGFKAKIWVNYPRRLLDDLTSGDRNRMRGVLLSIVVEHNGWCDSDGTPLPSASDAAFWDVIPDELAAALIALVLVEVGKLASSVRKKSGS